MYTEPALNVEHQLAQLVKLCADYARVTLGLDRWRPHKWV